MIRDDSSLNIYRKLDAAEQIVGVVMILRITAINAGYASIDRCTLLEGAYG